MSSTEQKFDSAVKVIRGLPKSGHFKPSDDLRLQFYAFYKQATEGSNASKKPAFYDLIGKAKWEAWTKMADMSREEAMDGYIKVFIDVLKTMVITDSDEDIFESLAQFKEYLPEESQQILSKHNY